MPLTNPAPVMHCSSLRGATPIRGSNTRQESITSFRIHPNDLDVEDVYREGNGLINRIIEVQDSPEPGMRCFKVQEWADRGGDIKDNIVTISASLAMPTLVGGPKLDQAKANPALAPHSGPGRLWVGNQKAQAAS